MNLEAHALAIEAIRKAYEETPEVDADQFLMYGTHYIQETDEDGNPVSALLMFFAAYGELVTVRIKNDKCKLDRYAYDQSIEFQFGPETKTEEEVADNGDE